MLSSKAQWLLSFLTILALVSFTTAKENADKRLPVANISSESSVMSTDLHCVQQFLPGGSVAGGKTFGNDSVSSGVNWVTTAGNSSDYMTALQFCKKAGYKDCKPLEDTVSNLAYLGIGKAQNSSLDTLITELYGNKTINRKKEVLLVTEPKHLSVPKEFSNIVNNTKDDELGPVGIKLRAQKLENHYQFSAQIAKKSCKKLPCDDNEFTEQAIRMSFNSSGMGYFKDLSIPSIFVAQSWFSETERMHDPSDSKVEYVGVLPQVIDVIGKVSALMGPSSSSSSSSNVPKPYASGLVVDDSGKGQNNGLGAVETDSSSSNVTLPTSLTVNYRIEILSGDSDLSEKKEDESRVDICGDLTYGVSASQIAQNLSTATGLVTASATAPASAITNRTKSSDAFLLTPGGSGGVVFTVLLLLVVWAF